VNPLTIQSAHARVDVCAELGAGLLTYSLADGTSVLRPSPSEIRSPFDLACNLMVPWCNRLSDGGFSVDGTFHPIEPNLPGQSLPLHGNAFQKPWTITKHDDASIELALISRGPGPYHYEAHVRYALDNAALIVDLGVWHWGETPLPYGLGLHPWFEKDTDTTVQFTADTAVLTSEHKLPTERIALHRQPAWQFDAASSLPDDGIDNAFAGWDGVARINWPTRGLAVEISTEPAQPCCHLFTPDRDADFFCFEPVSHLPNAHHWAGAQPDGLTTLEQGDGMEFRTVISPFGGR